MRNAEHAVDPDFACESGRIVAAMMANSASNCSDDSFLCNAIILLRDGNDLNK